MNNTIGLAFLLATLAGLSTLVGSVLAVSVRRPGPRFMSISMGFSAGVMVLVSFAELLPEGAEKAGFVTAYLAFFLGMAAMFLLDVLVPHIHMGETHDAGGEVPLRSCRGMPNGRGWDRRGHRHRFRGRHIQSGTLLKTGLLVALGIGIHNLPEGMATLMATIQDPALGIVMAVAIALHNIPEGIAVSAPVLAATGSWRRALGWSAISAAAEPAGAVLAGVFLLPLLSPSLLGTVLAAVAGVMVFISLDELIPVACSFCEEHLSILGVMAGMAVMALSLALLRK